jgi:uncharacterized lipoprotein YehR (DUF1307 family)
MKKSILLVITAISIISSFMITGCRKEHCYDCEKNVGGLDESKITVIGEEEKQTWESRGYHCVDNGAKKKKK